jgi:Ni/Fe-hydrogenase subunit HybB-like protein
LRDIASSISPRLNEIFKKLKSDDHSAHLDIKVMTPFNLVLAVLTCAAGVVAVYRLIFGIGAASNLNDHWPWGLWISFDVLGGVAMAAGGFLIAGAVYILNWKKYKPIARPAILNAFFGYLLAAMSICLDIGRSFSIWHPLVMWQVNSIMFIVSVHVVLYTSTLATESSPILFEKLEMNRALQIVNRFMVAIVLFGVLLSLLHQSSLGAVYLIVPGKLSPLWYSKYLPYMFLMSAIMMGLSMVSLETILSSSAFKHAPPREVITGLARGVLIVAPLYLMAKIALLVTGPGLGAVLNGSFTAFLWLLEMGVGVVLPLVLLCMRSVRTNLHRILVVDILVILGVLLNRLNVGIFGVSGYATRAGGDYFPSLMELTWTVGMVAFAILGFKLCAKYLHLFPETQH